MAMMIMLINIQCLTIDKKDKTKLNNPDNK